MNSILAEEVARLSPDEKMQLASELWDSVAAHAASREVPVAHQRILDQRLADHEANPNSALSLEEFRRQLTQRA